MDRVRIATTSERPNWKPNMDFAVGKGATVQRFVATVGNARLEMDVAPWGEGDLRADGVSIAHIEGRKDRRQAFRDLNAIAERYLQEQANRTQTGRSAESSKRIDLE